MCTTVMHYTLNAAAIAEHQKASCQHVKYLDLCQGDLGKFEIIQSVGLGTKSNCWLTMCGF